MELSQLNQRHFHSLDLTVCSFGSDISPTLSVYDWYLRISLRSYRYMYSYENIKQEWWNSHYWYQIESLHEVCHLDHPHSPKSLVNYSQMLEIKACIFINKIIKVKHLNYKETINLKSESNWVLTPMETFTRTWKTHKI